MPLVSFRRACSAESQSVFTTRHSFRSSFSAVSTPILGTKSSVLSIFQNLQDLHTFASLAFLFFVFENSSQPAPAATTKFKSLNPATLQSRWVSTKVRRKIFKISGNLWKFFESFRTFQMSMPRMIIASSKSTDTICKAKLGEFSRLPLYLLSRIQLCTSCTNALSFFIQFSYLLRIFLLSHLR